MGSNIPKIGVDDIAGCYLGSNEIEKIYLGENVIYAKSSPTPPHLTGVTLHGSCTNTNGVLGNFASDSYATIDTPFAPSGASWEIVIAFNITYIASYQGIMTGLGSSNYIAPAFCSNNFIKFYAGDGSSWSILDSQTYSSIDVGDNKFKITYASGTYTMFKWINSDWSLAGQYTGGSPIADGGTFVLGNNRGTGSPIRGTINLSECYIKIDNQLWWTGT